ncbi:hypothetical protein GGR26_001379 [Lewinella marina]|uniref:hypothetical protein n=1 Tax=Neolewinella marina TaxID=438751 RepID=UPI0014312D2E|nr:hypothetical protein [Neolewinella marina]NJB85634.1 hypothetical protein [Neolewinella marina]
MLRRGAGASAHPFALPTLCTVGPTCVPRPRKVVLRAVNSDTTMLRTYTDRRSVKATHLKEGSEASYVFWDPNQQLQLMTGGPTSWASEEEADAVFAGLPKHGRKAYATEAAPGTPLPSPGSGLPPDWEERDKEATDFARDHFGILVTTLRWADVLHLDRGGNTRMAGTRPLNGDWTWEWVVP